MEDPTVTEAERSEPGLSDPHQIPEPPPPIRLVQVNPALLPPVREQLVLSDEQGPIPPYPPRRYDNLGQPIPFSVEEVALRNEIFRRSMAVINDNDQDPPGSDEEFMRAIDSRRPPGMKLFEEYY